MKEQFLLVLAVIVLAAAFIALQFWKPTQAAAEPECPKVAETPNLSVYLCEPDNGPPFYINSYGFMVLVD